MHKRCKLLFSISWISLTLIFCFLTSVQTQSCSTGMRKIYLDNTNTNIKGSAKKIPLSIAYYEGVGSVWFNRQVLLEPRLEVHLKVFVNNLQFDQSSSTQIIDGFAIILSKTTNFLGGAGGNIGYNGITNSYILEVDYYQNSWDISANSISIHKCFGSTSCVPNESSDTKEVNLSNQLYNPKLNMNFDFRLVFTDGEVSVYSGDQKYITEKIDLISKFGQNIIYVGFSGFFRGNRKELNMLGSFICEDTYDITKTTGYFLVNGVKLTELTIKAGTSFRFIFSFINKKGQIIPHTYGWGIWTYTIRLSLQCGKPTMIGSEDKYYFYLNNDPCNISGRYFIKIISDQKGECPNIYYNVVANDLSIITYLGHNGGLDPSKIALNSSINSYRLTYGTANDNNFFISAGKVFILDFKLTDTYGNIVDLGTTDSATLLSKSGLKVTSSNSFSVTMNKNESNYQLKITIQAPGTYYIPITSYLKTAYHFIVHPGIPSPTRSSCSLLDYSTSPILKTGTAVKYSCTIRDSDGNLVTPSNMSTIYSYASQCLVSHKITPSTVSTGTVAISGNVFLCTTTPSKMGDYTIDFSIGTSSSTTKTAVSATINAFSVHPIPTKFTGMQLYGIATKTWGSGTTLTHANDNTGLLFAIDLTDVDNTTLISTYKYHSDFSVSSIVGVFSSAHDTRINITLVAKYLLWNNKPYIGLYFPAGTSTDNFVKKSSYPYTVTLKLGSDTRSVTINNTVTGIGVYKTCTHDLTPANTVVTLFTENHSIIAGEEKIISEFILQTSDKHLYIVGLTATDFTNTISPQDATTSLKITEDSSLLGKYKVTFTSKTANQYTVKISIKGTQVFNKIITVNPSTAYSFAIPDTSIYNVSGTKYTFKKTFTTDETPKMPFIAKDKNGNQLLVPWDSSNNGMEFRVSVNGIWVLSSSAIVAEYVTSKWYEVVEYHKDLGTFSVEIRSKESGNSITFVYTKIPGNLSYTKSNMVLVSSNIIINSDSFVDIEFNDASGFNLANDATLFNAAVSATKVIATSPTGSVTTYNYSKKTAANKAQFIATIKTAATFKVTGTHNSQNIPCAQNQLIVAYNTFDIKKSQMNVLLDVMVEMSQNSELNIENAIQRPIYKLIFKDANGKDLEYVDPDSNIKATMTGDNFSTELIMSKSNNFFTMKYDNDVVLSNLVSGSYKLNVILDGNVALTYPLKWLGDGEDDDAGNGDYDLSKTNFSVTIINGIAGNTYDVNLEFRTAQNYRWNNNGDASQFSFDNSLNLGASQITIKSARGGKKGQFIISIMQTKTTVTNTPNKITLKYESTTIPQTLSVNIRNADLASLVIDPTCLTATGSKVLKPGTVITVPDLLFTPYDKYNNVYTDLFDSTIFTSERLSTLINVSHSGSGAITQTAKAVLSSQKLTISFISRMKGTLSITSVWIPNTIYTMQVTNGPIDPDVSSARLSGATEGIAGTTFTLIIDPRDKYGNTLDDWTNESVAKFGVSVNNPKTGWANITTGVLKVNYIEYTMTLTEAGTIVISPKFVETSGAIKCTSCAVKVNWAAFDFSNTVVAINGNTLSTATTYQLDSSSSPTFIVSFFDKYNNQITNIANINISATFTGNASDIKVCNEDSNSNKLVFLCRTTVNTNNWFYLINGVGYQLTVNNEGKSLVFPWELIGNPNSDGSNAAVDLSKTEFSRTWITKLAGELGSFAIEWKAIDGKRKNLWYTNPEDEIKVSFAKDSATCSSSVVIAEKPGQYTITVQCTKTAWINATNKISLTIEGTTLEKTVALIVNPNEAVVGHFIDSWGNKINQGSFPTANADDNYTLKLNLYDIFNNLANEDVNKVTYTVEPPAAYGDSNVSNTISKNSDNTFTIVIKPIYSGKYELKSRLFPTTYTFDTEPGAVVGDNSLILTVDTAVAGDTVKAYIIPYDKNNNYIDPLIYLAKIGNPFSVSFKYKVDHENYGTYEALTVNDIEAYNFNDKNVNVFAYPNKLIHRYTNYYRATLGNAELKCLQCITEVSPGPMHFPNSLLLGFSTSWGQFVEINDKTVEDNTKNDIIYRIYPRDTYGNTIDVITDLKKYSIVLEKDVKYPLKIANVDDGKQAYVEFEKFDTPSLGYEYNTLVGGEYTCKFSNGNEVIVKNIKLAGSPGDEFASNQEIDFQQTHINSMSLNYVAGYTGEMFIELRTINGLRKKTNLDYKFEIINCYTKQEDPSFEFTSEKSGTLGVFYITVKSTKANTYPTLKECKYTIKIDNIIIVPLKPATQISPNVISYTLPKKDYIKKDKTLLDGNADITYKFEMITYDRFGNVNQANQSTIKISVLLSGATVGITSQVNTATGEIEYIVDNKKSGIYTLDSGTDYTGKNYWEDEYTFTITHGSIVPGNSIIKVENTSILAGENAKITLIPMDKNNNAIPVEEAFGKFLVTCTENGGQTKQSTETKVDGKLEFNSNLTVAGDAIWTIKYNTEDISNNGAYKTEVKPYKPSANHSIISVKNSLDVLVQYKNNDTIPAYSNTPIEFDIKITDIYNNLIPEIDPNEVQIISPIMKGNDMEEIKLVVTYPSKDTIKLSIPEDKIYSFNHWVQSKDYSISFTVKTEINQADFKFPINLTSDRNTEGYGNGLYVPSQTKIAPQTITIYAGETAFINMKLQTAKGLMYNDDINLTNDIDYTLSKEDNTFDFGAMKVSPDVYADYNIHISSTKAMKSNVLTIKLKDPISNTMTNWSKTVTITVLPQRLPEQKETKLISHPKEEIKAGEQVEIQFKLYDKYGNQFIGMNDIITNDQISIINNSSKTDNSRITLSVDGETFIANFLPTYPPRDCVINLIFKDGDRSVIILPTNINTKIISNSSWTNTEIVTNNASKMIAGEKLNMSAYVHDNLGICVDTDYPEGTFHVESTGPLESIDNKKTYKYYLVKIQDPDLNCQNRYDIHVEDKDIYTTAGTYTIIVKEGSQEIKRYTQTVVPAGFDIDQFKSVYVAGQTINPSNVPASEIIKFIVSGKDIFGNDVYDTLSKDLSVFVTREGKEVSSDDYKITYREKDDGIVNFELEIEVIGSYEVVYMYKGETIKTINNSNGPSVLYIVAGKCSEKYPKINVTALDKVILSEPTTITMACHDQYNNEVKKGGNEILAVITLQIGETSTNVKSLITDQNNGKYDITFSPPLAGVYVINIYLDGNAYGERIEFNVKATTCEGDTPLRCPNIDKCVADPIDCIDPPNDCERTKPFKCLVNQVSQCVASQNECDCPTGFIKCTDFPTKYCVPEDKEYMCPFAMPVTCKRYTPATFLCPEGTCQLGEDSCASPRVCPIGKVLCADLTCRDDYSKCLVHNDCWANEVKCLDQTCTTNQFNCPTTVSCSSAGKVVCSDGSCVDNEIYCKSWPKCSEPNSFLCPNNSCVSNYNDCPKSISCSNTLILCADKICRSKC